MTTDDEQLAQQLRILRDHGQSPQYHHHLVGANSRLDTLQAAALSIRLPHLETWTNQRGENATRYAELFAQVGVDESLVPPREVAGRRHVWNQYTIRATGGRRDALKQALADSGVGSAIYYPVPLHVQKCFTALGYKPGSLPQTETAAREVLSLPIFPGLTGEEIEYVAQTLAEVWPATAHREAAA